MINLFIFNSGVLCPASMPQVLKVKTTLQAGAGRSCQPPVCSGCHSLEAKEFCQQGPCKPPSCLYCDNMQDFHKCQGNNSL